MEDYDKLYVINLSQPRECYRSKQDKALYEKYRIPNFSNEILALKSPYLQEPTTIIDEESSLSGMVLFDLNRNLEFILLKNEPLEETYISLIIKMIIEATIYVHSLGLSGILFQLYNFTLTINGKLMIKNRFGLYPNAAKKYEDWNNFCGFIRRIIPIESWDDKNLSISRNFKHFLRELGKLNAIDSDYGEPFEWLSNFKFLSHKSNILNDLVDDNISLDDSEMNKILMIQRKDIKDIYPLAKSANASNLSFDFAYQSLKMPFQPKSNRYLEILSEVFEKYRFLEKDQEMSNIVKLLNAMENSLKNMESNKSHSSLELIRSYLKNSNL